jgi:hypothetical protein
MSARDDALTLLNEFGLGALIDKLDAAIKDDPTQFQTQFAAENAMRVIRDTPEYKTRFKGLELRSKAGFPPISERQYVQIEDDYRQVLRTNGMPLGFYDSQQDFEKFIGNDIRGDELNTRIQGGIRAVQEAEPGTVAELKRLYGLGDGDIAAFFLDPEKTKNTDVVRRAEAARRATAAREQAIEISRQQAEELVNRGVTQSVAQQGFTNILESQQLFGTTTAEAAAGETAISQAEQIAGTFGTNAAAQQRIATRRRKRTAEFEQGGGLAATQQGVVGLRTVGQ